MEQGDVRRLGERAIPRRMLLKAVGAVAALGCGAWLTACRQDTQRVVDMVGQSKYAPAHLAIKVGETVTWRNRSTIDHTATGDPAKVLNRANVRLPTGAAPWDSGTIAAGKSWSRRFDVPGEYRYCCLPHELAGMVGTLIVEP